MFEEMIGQGGGYEDEPNFPQVITIEEEDDAQLNDAFPSELAVLPLKNTVLFPGIVSPITVGRDKSIKAIQAAYDTDKLIAVVAQKDLRTEDPKADDLYEVGTIAKIIKLLKMPDGTTTAILQGKKRCSVSYMPSPDDYAYLKGNITPLPYTMNSKEMEFEAVISSVKENATHIVQLSHQIPQEAKVILKNITSHSFLLNFIASNLNLKVGQKQRLLETSDLYEKAHSILRHMDTELQMLELKEEIESKVRTDIEKQQRDYFLNQQLKTIQEELGQDPLDIEAEGLQDRAAKKKWGDATRKVFDKEVNKLSRMNPQAPEYSITMNFLEVMLELPWNDYTKDNFDLGKVEKVLNKDHFGLEKVKKRILEHLAVLKLKGDMKAPILCLVGPPGVGKTSLGKSIATALKRKFVRMSLGGVHDEAEVRGHRKTYIGAMPGRVIQSIKKAKSSNPVFILDEIDKIGRDFRGDPSSALLEVLDPEQNHAFYDNYLEQEFDLSKVMFIATANSLSGIQQPLLDRMEILELSGYTVEEKIEIAERHLIPRQREAHGLKPNQIKLKKEIVQSVIQEYTRESGVRSLDRQIAGVMRGVAKSVAMKETYNVQVSLDDMHTYLGPTIFSEDLYQESKEPGVAVGLAWTQVGGDILFLECVLSKGTGKLIMTGNLGDVMKESATTALTFLKAHAEKYGIEQNLFSEKDVHIHVPEGGIPKDGPSAGITMLTTLASAFTGKTVKPFLAMTGEITLRGKVLPVGGIKEKILAAKRAGIKEIILCKENKKHIEEIEKNYLEGLTFHFVDKMHEVLELALTK
jgi:ATP-dependent Lon protease